MNTYVHLWYGFAEFVLEWEMFHTTAAEKVKPRFMSKIIFFTWVNVENYGREGQATHNNLIKRMRFAWWVTKATNTYSEYVIHIAFPRQQWLCEHVSQLRCTDVNCLDVYT